MVAGGDMHGCGGACMVAGVCAWLWGGVHRIRGDTVNERVVRILLECILVFQVFDVWLNLTSHGSSLISGGGGGGGKSNLERVKSILTIH